MNLRFRVKFVFRKKKTQLFFGQANILAANIKAATVTNFRGLSTQKRIGRFSLVKLPNRQRHFDSIFRPCNSISNGTRVEHLKRMQQLRNDATADAYVEAKMLVICY